MFTCTNIYITIMPKNLMFCNRCFMSSAVVLIHTIEFTSDSCNLLKNCSTLYYICIFNITLYVLLFSMCIDLLLSTSFSYHILFHALCFYLFHKSTAVYHTCIYTMMYGVCHLHHIYIYEIYTLA